MPWETLVWRLRDLFERPLVWRLRDFFGRPRRIDGPFVAEVTEDAVVIGGDATWALRESTPLWQDLRQRLKDYGIDPGAAEIVESYMEGPTRKPVEVGVVVSVDGRVIEYAYSHKDEWTKWLDRTHTWRDAKYAAEVERALDRLSGFG